MATHPLIALDSQAFTFLIRANSGSYDPTTDDPDLAAEHIAVFRVFVYYPGLILGLPTVTREIKPIPDPSWKREHEIFDRVHLLIGVPLPAQKVDALAKYYEILHRDLDDCRVVAEAELSRVNFLLTYDFDLIKHLEQKTGHLVLCKPSWFWGFLKLPAGTPPNWAPFPSSHPLALATWWRV